LFKEINAMRQVLQDIKLPAYKKEELLKKRLKAVLISAYKNVPYYRSMMKNIGYDPAIDHKGQEDLKKFPITTKQELKMYDQLMLLKDGVNTEDLYSVSTSGSTGMPFKIFLSNDELAFRIAKWLRVLFFNKYSVKDKVISLTVRSDIDQKETIFQKFGFLRRLVVNSLLPASKLVEIILDYKPNVLYGNRSPISLLAMELVKRKIKPVGLKLVLVGGEMFHKHDRDLHYKAYGTEPIEFYGSEEMGVMAFETPERDGLHLCDDLTYFEFLDKNNNPVLPGEPGRIVVTDLIGTTMPFIRYDQGDLVNIKIITGYNRNPENRISEIIGRDNDYIVLPDGSAQTSYYFFYDIVKQFDKIMQFRVTQKTKTYYKIEIVANKEYFVKIEGQIIELLNKKFPENCYFELLLVDHIEPDQSGKLRAIISEIKDDNIQ
jgi:phenylacetate-CoA ligase